jgi:hypothetical protein
MNQVRDVTAVAAATRIIMLAAISVTLIGCKDVGRDMAICKVKAMELYKPASIETDDRTTQYVRNCMEAMGYRLLSHCTYWTAGYTSVTCYE